MKRILFLIEKKAEKIDDKKLLIYFISFLYLRLILETAFSYNLRIGGKLVFFDSIRMLFIDHPIFFFNAALLVSFLISIFSGENENKILKIVLLFTPLILMPPLYDFIFHGGGARYYYLLNPEEVLKNLLKGEWVTYSLGFSRGQVIELALVSLLSSLYLFLKGKKIKAIIFLPIPFLFIILIGSPYFLSIKFLGKNIFDDSGFLYYSQDKILVYNIIILTFLSLYFKKIDYIKIDFKWVPSSIFILFGFLTAYQKIDFPSLILFDYLSLPLMILIIFMERKNYLSIFLSISTAISLGLTPFILFILYFLFEKVEINKGLKEFIISLCLFYAGAGFFLKTRAHLSYPFYYPFFVSVLYGIFNSFFYKFRYIPLLLLPLGFFLKGKTIFLSMNPDIIQELEQKYSLLKDPAYLYDLWSFYMGKGDFKKVEEITFSLKFEYSPSDYYGKLADLYLLKGNLNEAEKFAEKSLPCGNPFFLLTLGHIYHIKGDDRALKYIKKAHSMKLNPERSFFLLISEYLKKGKNKEALKALEEMRKFDEKSPIYKILSQEILKSLIKY